MKNSIIGYIVTNEDFPEPLMLCDCDGYPHQILLRASEVTFFKTRKEANKAICQTLEWSEWRQSEDISLKPLKWAQKSKYIIWRLRSRQGDAGVSTGGYGTAEGAV